MKYFKKHECEDSAIAKAKGIDNSVPDDCWQNWIHLGHAILDPLREALGHPVNVSSGYRCKALNDIVPGASKTSNHMKGQAADLQGPNRTLEEAEEIYNKIVEMKLPYTQCYVNTKLCYCHVDYTGEERPRQQHWIK